MASRGHRGTGAARRHGLRQDGALYKCYNFDASFLCNIETLTFHV